MIVSASNLTKTYGKKEVLQDVCLTLEEGRIYALLGRNGAGKSTMLSILAGQNPETDGTLAVFGSRPFDLKKVMDRIVYAGIDVPYPVNWRLGDILRVAEARYPRFDRAVAKRISELFEIPTDTAYAKLSRGQRSMIGIVVGLAARAELTLLDEPYIGLDVHNRELFYQLLMEEQRDVPRTVVLATHHVEESSKLIDHFLVLGRDGRIAVDLNAEALADAYVEVSAPEVPLVEGELARRRGAGRERVIVPRAAYECGALGRGASMLARPVELGDVVVALVEES